MLFEMNVDVRIFREKRGQRGWQELDNRRDVGEYPDMAARTGGVPPDLFVDLACLVQNATRTRQEGTSRRRELNSLGAAHQQWRAEGFFEVGESFAYRGGDRVTPLRRPRNAAGLRDRDEVLEIAEVEVQEKPTF